MEDNQQNKLIEAKQKLGEDTFKDIRRLAKEVISSGLSPLASESAVMISIISGRELGIPPMAAINNIYDIQGKATQSIHLMNALAIKNNVSFEVLKDFEIEKTYTDANGITYDEDEVQLNVKNELWQLATNAQLKDPVSKQKIIEKGLKVIIVTTERVTEILLTRELGPNKIRTFKSKYKYSTAVRSGLVKKGGAWENDPANQCLVRALSKGFRYLGDDFLLAMPYETTEMMDAKGIEYKISDESIVSNITIIESADKKTESKSESNLNNNKNEIEIK